MDQLFLDANILFTATYSQSGASYYIFQLAKAKKLKIVTSKYALREASRNIEKKLPKEKIIDFLELISHLSTIINERSPQDEELYAHLINPKDLPILVSAKLSNSNYLITLDKKDFETKSLKDANLPFKILSPKKYLEDFS